jgi:hypothetical protein
MLAGLALVATACASSADRGPREMILEEHARALMIAEAQAAFRAQFGTTFDPAKTRLVVGTEVRGWFRENHRSLAALPEPFRHTVSHGEQAALIIDDALPSRTGGRQSVLYLRAFRPGFTRWLVLGQPEPCADGNPPQCERCTGCRGEGGPGAGDETCVCTLSCTDCVPCSPCPI